MQAVCIKNYHITQTNTRDNKGSGDSAVNFIKWWLALTKLTKCTPDLLHIYEFNRWNRNR